MHKAKHVRKKRKFSKFVFIVILLGVIIYGFKYHGNQIYDFAKQEFGVTQKKQVFISEEKQNSKEQEHLLLVNRWNPLLEDYHVKLKLFDDGREEKSYVANEIVGELTQLIHAAESDGIELCINSAYRSREEQKFLFENKVEEYLSQGYSEKEARAETEQWVAIPGTSEHETGLAIDFGLLGNTTWEDGYGWLAEHASEYGFILRYPSDKVDVTGVAHEPWHYRYVGENAARDIAVQRVCLEEYLQNP